MSEAPNMPERIWAYAWTGQTRKGQWHSNKSTSADEYIRADLVEAAVKRAIEACTRRAEKLSECCQSCAGVGREVRAIFQEPDAIAKIIWGEN